MSFMTDIGNFFLSIWLWNLTFGIGHFFIATPLLFALLYFVCNRRLLRAALLSIGSYVVACVFLGLCALTFGDYAYTQLYPVAQLSQEHTSIDVFRASMLLALTYTVIQFFFFLFVHPYNRRTGLSLYIVLIFVNGAAAYINYVWLRLFMWYIT